MAAAAGKGSAQNMNSLYFKPMLRKAYHRKSSTWADMVAGDSSVKLKGGREEEEEEEDVMMKAVSCSKNKNSNVKSFVNHERVEDHHDPHHDHHPRRSWSSTSDQNDDAMNLWAPDNRTGIYYPKGQEKVMEDVSPLAGKDLGVNWFSHP